MSKRKLYSEAIEQYNLEFKDLVDKINQYYSSSEKVASKVDSILSECDIKVEGNLADLYSSMNSDDLSTELKANLDVIKKSLTTAEEKSINNDKLLKEAMTERSAEVKQLRGIMAQYAAGIQGAKSLSSAGLVSNLQGINKSTNINDIPGVSEGRQKVLERDITNGKMQIHANLVEEVKKTYKHLSEEEMNIVLEYYMFKNMKASAVTAIDPWVLGRNAELLLVNGKYECKYEDNVIVDFLKTKGSIGANLYKPSFSATKDINGNDKVGVNNGIGANASGAFQTASGSFDNSSWSAGNVSAKVSVNKNDLGFSVGGSAAEFTQKFTIHEGDLYSYGGSISISALSAQIKASLSSNGFQIRTPGLVGISVSGGRTELIEVNVDL